MPSQWLLPQHSAQASGELATAERGERMPEEAAPGNPNIKKTIKVLFCLIKTK